MSEAPTTPDLTEADKETAEIRRALDSGEITIDEANARQTRVAEAVSRLTVPGYSDAINELDAARAIPIRQIDTPKSMIKVHGE